MKPFEASRYEERHGMPAFVFTRRLPLLLLALCAVTLLCRKEIWPDRFTRYTDLSSDQLRQIAHLERAEASPRLASDEAPIRVTKQSVCYPGRHTSGISRYALPSTHPSRTIGVDLYRDNATCTTYAERYKSYEEHMLQSSYMIGYAPFNKDTGESTDRLAEANRMATESHFTDWNKVIAACHGDAPLAKQALVLRSYENYTWGHDDIRNVRALINELALHPDPSKRHDVFILVDIHQRNVSFAASEKQRNNVLLTSVPREFWSLTHLWSEEQMQFLYPGLVGHFKNHMIAQSSYRSCFMPLQAFGLQHQDYDYIWNWEMDTRSTHDYAEVLADVSKYARRVAVDPTLSLQSAWHVVGDGNSAGRFMGDDPARREADLITLNPIFDVDGSGWYWADDFQNMPESLLKRASIGRNVRFSKRLLRAMNHANADDRQSAHCESFPASTLVHEQGKSSARAEAWKGVFVPHPIYTQHVWPPEILSRLINQRDVYRKIKEKTLRDVSFYYDGHHAKRLYDAWRADPLVCLSPALLHPIKRQG